MEKKTKGVIEIKGVVKKVGVCSSNVIIVHAGTCDIKTETPDLPAKLGSER